MTLITRISNKSGVYIASDNQLNDKGGYSIGITFKAFKYPKSIGAISGLIYDRKSNFNILDVIAKYNTLHYLINGIRNDITQVLKSEKSVLMISSLTEGNINNNTFLVHNSKVKSIDKIKALTYNKIHVSPLVENNDFTAIEQSFDSDFYLAHLDFNWNYSIEDDNIKSFLHSLFHVKSYYKYGSESLNALLHESDENIIAFLLDFYVFIDNLKNNGTELLKGYYKNHQEYLKTIGICNSIMKLDIDSGSKILYPVS